jgi:hypothetical protein
VVNGVRRWRLVIVGLVGVKLLMEYAVAMSWIHLEGAVVIAGRIGDETAALL